MHSRKVRLITAFATLACLLWLFGLGWTLKDYLIGASRTSSLPSVTEEPAIQTNALKIVALGDSLTRGTGDIEGKGYVGYVSDQLQEAGKEISLINLGIKGLTSPQLAEQMKEKEIRRQLGQANVILMTIGGNDLFLGGQILSDVSEASIEGLEDAYLVSLKTIISSIREVNTEATVYLLGLYNPFSEFENGELLSGVVRGWNFKAAELLAQDAKTVFVPTYDLFQQKINDYLFTDHFHPNEKGYRLIAERITALITGEGGPS
ncbi:SGNH/GDSL hydrolase family protein [Paenibacillus sp. LHD-38]|uniref:SGNH/GDSL hydrolase family protein n=1 Tax=Paenibacillus sp. LHD-38 TaxID=3072143 RepID=UPI00280DD29F|nr:SGNH/GDSL hydrolase family protein [Paenibacillus sp. LHD-38]MDQ8734732.1 SGNH/GDSL hydrolase family protein [Paenibacillus sp. LHD-38]